MQSTDTLEKSQVLTFRVTGRQKRLYEIAAKESGLTFLDFLRKSLDAAAEKTFQNMLIEKLKRLNRIFERAGLSRDEVLWSRVLDASEWFPNEQIEILEKRSVADIKNYLNMVLEKTA